MYVINSIYLDTNFCFYLKKSEAFPYFNFRLLYSNACLVPNAGTESCKRAFTVIHFIYLYLLKRNYT